MKKTEFLLKLKLQKGIGYVKLLTIANQLTDETEIEFEELEQIELTEELMDACYRAFQDDQLDRMVQQIEQQCDVISFFDEAYPEKLRHTNLNVSYFYVITADAYKDQSDLKVSLIAVGWGIGICHGDKPCLQRRLYIIFSECHARFQAELFHQLHRRHRIRFYNGH